jgi:uncharacterized protein
VIASNDPNENRAVLEAIASSFRPHCVVAPATDREAAALAGKVALLADRPARDGRTTTYICENFTCQAPVVGLEELKSALAIAEA